MGAVLQPSANRRVLVDYVHGIGEGRRICQLGDEFFYETGEFLRDMSVVELLAPPFQEQARRFIERVLKHDEKVKSEAVVEAPPPAEPTQVGEAKGVVDIPGVPPGLDIRRG